MRVVVRGDLPGDVARGEVRGTARNRVVVVGALQERLCQLLAALRAVGESQDEQELTAAAHIPLDGRHRKQTLRDPLRLDGPVERDQAHGTGEGGEGRVRVVLRNGPQQGRMGLACLGFGARESPA